MPRNASPREGTTPACSNVTLEKSVTIRPYHESDRADVFSLLADLPLFYPDALSWLDQRLRDVLAGRARCTLALFRSSVVGITIETPKQPRRLKLSTFFVHPNCRRRGIGSCLLATCQQRWVRDQLEHVYITVPAAATADMLPLLERFGFQVTSVERNLYGPGLDEVILYWRPHSSGA